MWITPAYAQAATADFQTTLQSFVLPMVLVFVVFYFLVFRPQQKKAKDHKAMLAALRRGDRVVTGGGIIGTVAKVVNDDEVAVDIAEGTRVRILRSTISSVLAKPEPVGKDKDGGRQKDRDEKKAKAKSDDGDAPESAPEAAAEGREKQKSAVRGGAGK
ncbi:MAG TPA: preprotein translocase subunit YajC [Stellaceae bacterium]|nr:preprotein translocase subunit YajC [Stellaceae bacterium]